ncbi:MAG: aminotransferase class IV [Caldilineaceae bacterium]|nr:aminotransferase class IV [Caldilineaceae bacterium]
MSSLSPSFVVCNGEVIPPPTATISVLGSTLYGAFGVYESIQLWNGVVFHLDDHLERLLASARAIELPLAGDLAAHRGWVHQLIRAEGSPPDATIRLFSVGPDAGTPPRSFIWLEALHPPTAQMNREGVGAVSYGGERALPTVKSLNTLVNTLARRAAQAAGAHEGLLIDKTGHVREGASSTFYAVQNGQLLIPPAEDILEGVTLQIVLRLAEEAGIPVRRVALPLTQCQQWDEAFLTSTSRHILPLVRLDGAVLGDGTPGPITHTLSRRFETYFAAATGRSYCENP